MLQQILLDTVLKTHSGHVNPEHNYLLGIFAVTYVLLRMITLPNEKFDIITC